MISIAVFSTIMGIASFILGVVSFVVGVKCRRYILSNNATELLGEMYSFFLVSGLNIVFVFIILGYIITGVELPH